MGNYLDIELIEAEADTEIDSLSEFFGSDYPFNQYDDLSNDILLVTSEINSKYPELYKYLDETPLAVKDSLEKNITVNELKNYRETLTNHLVNYFETHELSVTEFDFKF